MVMYILCHCTREASALLFYFHRWLVKKLPWVSEETLALRTVLRLWKTEGFWRGTNTCSIKVWPGSGMCFKWEWNGTHRLVHLNTWPQLVNCLRLGGVALMEKIIHLGGVAEFFKFLAITSVRSLPPAYIFTWVLSYSCHHAFTLPSRTLTLWNCSPIKSFLLVFVTATEK